MEEGDDALNNITLTITKREVARTGGLDPVEGNVSADSITVTFDSEWDGLDRFATFQNGDVSVGPVEYYDHMPIPHEVTASKGMLFISFSGRNGDALVLRSETMSPICVRQGDPIEGEEPTPATRDIIAQAMDARDAANEAATHAEEAAEKLDTLGAAATTLPPDSQATAEYDHEANVLRFGIPSASQGTSDHSQLDNLEYDMSGHRGFQRELTPGDGIDISEDGTISNSGVVSIAVNAEGSLVVIQGATV